MSRSLALAVIVRAIEDAADVRLPQARRGQARAFLHSRDCEFWCALADVDPGDVHGALRRRVSEG
jgi:hypothetical protein